jgi:hypothetical protein
MKQCPACKKTFEDSMKFCQTDGTPLVVLVENIPQTPTEENPFKTVVANAQSLREDDILQLPIEHDPMKTMVVSDFKKDIPLPKINQDVSQPLNPPIFDEPSLSPPNFGDLSPATPIKPIEVEPPTIMSPELPSFDATFTSMPLPSDSPFGSLPNKPNTSPFDQPMSSPFDTPKYEPPVFKEPEPIYTSQNEPFGNPFGQPNQMEQSAWTPPPAPDQNWANQGVGQNTPFQPPMVSSGQGQGQEQTLAIVSLVCGILGVCCGILSIAALITGFIQRGNIARDPNRYGGGGLALAGMILGGIGIIIMIISLFLNLLPLLLR